MLIDGLARTPGTLLSRELTGDDWTLDQHLVALIADHLAVANWQRQGKQGAPRPKPLSPLAQQRRKAEQVGNTGGRTQQDIDGLLRAMRTGVVGGG